MRLGLRLVSVILWALWIWANQVGCGSFRGACLPLNPLDWPLASMIRLIFIPGLLVGVFFALTARR